MKKRSSSRILMKRFTLSLLSVKLALLSTFAQEPPRSQGNPFRVPEITIERSEHMIDVGGRKLHSYVYGNEGPTVILINGFNAPQESWNAVVLGLADEATVVTYDRAGVGKSEIGSLPTHGKQSAIDLHYMIDKLDVPKPYILVGHSYGVGVTRLYADQFRDDLGGLVLLEGQHPDILDEQMKVLTGADLERLKRMSSGRPEPEQKITEADYMFVTLEQRKKIGILEDIPCTVVTAGAHRERGIPPGFSEEGREKLLTLGLEMKTRLVEDIPGAEHVILENLSHMLHLEDPQPIIDIIKEMIEDVSIES